jgi:hypothetical protein
MYRDCHSIAAVKMMNNDKDEQDKVSMLNKNSADYRSQKTPHVGGVKWFYCYC